MLVTYALKVAKKSRLPRLTLSQSANCMWHLTVEVSLPTLLRDSNAVLCKEPELPKCFDKLQKYVDGNISSPFVARQAKVMRADFAEDTYLGNENIRRTVSRLLQVSVPGYEIPKAHGLETIAFRNSGKAETNVITVYDKFQQMLEEYPQSDDLELTRGSMRLETKLRKSRLETIEKNLGLTYRSAASFLTQKVADYALADAKRKIDWNSAISVESDWIIRSLPKIPRKQRPQLIGFLCLYHQFGCRLPDIPEIEMTKRTYDRYRSDCRKYGISLFE